MRNVYILTNVQIDVLIEQIRETLARRLLTQAELARMAGISPQRVYAVLHGRSKSLKTIRAMRDALVLAGYQEGELKRA